MVAKEDESERAKWVREKDEEKRSAREMSKTKGSCHSQPGCGDSTVGSGGREVAGGREKGTKKRGLHATPASETLPTYARHI